MSDPDRRAILARRQRFLRAAVASAGMVALSACDSSGKTCGTVRRTMPRLVAETVGCYQPHVCLSVAIVDGGAPTPCLSAPLAPVVPDAGGKRDE